MTMRTYQMKRIKRLALVVLFLLPALIFVEPLLAKAAAPTSPPLLGEVVNTPISASVFSLFDDAGLLVASETAQLQEEGERVVRKHPDVAVAVITTNDTGGKDTVTYGDDYFESHDLGYGPDYNGVYILIDMDNRIFYLGTFGRVIGVLSDNRIEQILDNTNPAMRAGDYASALETALRDIDDYLDAGIAPENEPGYVPETSQGIDPVQIVVTVGGFGLTTVGTALGYKSKVKRDYDKYADRPAYDSLREATADYRTITDQVVDRHVATAYVPRPRNNSSSGGGGGFSGSSTHTTGGGHSSGGGGRGF